MDALKRAVALWQDMENVGRAVDFEEDYDMSTYLGCEAANGGWCMQCCGPKPNRCARCYVYTFGDFCAVCLDNISPYYDESEWNCGSECGDPDCYPNRIKAPGRPKRRLRNKSELPRNSRVFIQL